MTRLQQDIDDLDRMVDSGAQKAEVRSQIRVIETQVTTLIADYARLAQDHENLHTAKIKVDAELANLKNQNLTPSVTSGEITGAVDMST